MIWGKTAKQREAEWKLKYEKHQWFAWHPVILDNGQWAWWQLVRRQRFMGDDYFFGYWRYEL